MSRVDDSAPTFKAIFGDDWEVLPPVIKKHYANRPYSNDVTVVIGKLDVMCKPPLLWLAPIMKLIGQIPTFNETNVPVTVRFESDLESRSFHFNRSFHFAHRQPYLFHSRMYQVSGNEVVERMRFGLCWKLAYQWDGKKVILSHRGYAMQLFGKLIPIPLTFLLGSGYAEEWPIDDGTFEMAVQISHPWWGKIYGYNGKFKVVE